MKYIDLSLRDYVNKVATRSMPGGGSIAALSCALAVALLMKASQISRKKITKDMMGLKQRFLEIVDEDILMFKAGPKEAASILLELCRTINRALKLAEPISKNAKPILKGDINLALHLLVSAFNSAYINIEINLKDIPDRRFASNIRKTITPLNRKGKSFSNGFAV